VDKAGRLGATPSGPGIRPLAMAHDLGALTHLMLPAGITPPPGDVMRYLRGIAEGARELVRQSLIEGSAEGRPEHVLAAIETIGIGLVAAYEDQFARQRRIDASFEQALAGVECRKGCSFCCRLKVTGTVLEVVRIAAAIGAGRFPDRRSVVLSAADKVAGLDDTQRLAGQVPCPLLIEGACSVYEIRPITCRALLSRSVSLCERQFDVSVGTDDNVPVPSPVTPRLLSACLINGQIAALRDLGLPSRPVDLITGLAALERDPNLFVRWLSGEDVFARA
jgi:hypothetical protein